MDCSKPEKSENSEPLSTVILLNIFPNRFPKRRSSLSINRTTVSFFRFGIFMMSSYLVSRSVNTKSTLRVDCRPITQSISQCPKDLRRKTSSGRFSILVPFGGAFATVFRYRFFLRRIGRSCKRIFIKMPCAMYRYIVVLLTTVRKALFRFNSPTTAHGEILS